MLTFQGISNAYEITILKFKNPHLSDVKPNISSVMEYEIPDSVDREVYADPGNKEEMIYDWFEANEVCKINSKSIK